jgi:carboxyl-terminal processing protease
LYQRGFATTNELFLNVVYDSPNTDNKSVLLDDYNLIQQPTRRTSITHGVEYVIIAEPGNAANVIGFVQYILPNSNASTLSIKRGDFFYAVDDVQLTRDNFNSLLEATATSYELSMADFDGTTVAPNGTKISLTKAAYTHNPVFMSKNIASGGNSIGYLLYNNDFSSNYINDLNTTFLQFKNQGVNQLILDLRYNVGGGSFVHNINQIASMITGQFTNQPFAKNCWNSKAQAWFELNQPDSLITNFTDKINNTTPINSLELTDVYIILNGSLLL